MVDADGITNCKYRAPGLWYNRGMRTPAISHTRQDESIEAKARWFQALSVPERMDYLCFVTDLVAENQTRLRKASNAEPSARRVRVLSKS